MEYKGAMIRKKKKEKELQKSVKGRSGKGRRTLSRQGERKRGGKE